MNRYWLSYRILPNGVMSPAGEYEAIIKGETWHHAQMAFRLRTAEQATKKKIYVDQRTEITPGDIYIDETIWLDRPLQN